MAERRIMSQINVTPLVDVILVLLIIFMVTAPMMQEGIDVNLPKVETGGLETPQEPVVISIDRKGDIYVNDTLIGVNQLKTKLSAIFKRRSDRMVLLRSDASVPYGSVVRVLAEIRRAGIHKIGMVTEPEPGKRRVK